MTWERFRELFEEEYLPNLRPPTRERYADVLDLFEELCQPARLRSDQRINVLMNGKARYEMGDQVYANFAPDHVYLFDGRSEQALHGISLQ